jgi:hypothetical protein
VRGSNLGRGKRFFSSLKRPDRLWGQPTLLFNGYYGSFPRAKRPARELDHLPACSADIKHEWRHTFTPHAYFRGVDIDSFSFASTDNEN